MSNKMNTYEGMFLMPPGVANFELACEPIQNVLGRSEAEILSMKAWDERKLAYEIGGHTRGMYILTYFKADPLRIAEIEHDCQLNEDILRVIIIRQDKLTDEQINADTPATSRMTNEPPPVAETAEATTETEQAEPPVEEAVTQEEPAQEQPVEEQPAEVQSEEATDEEIAQEDEVQEDEAKVE